MSAPHPADASAGEDSAAAAVIDVTARGEELLGSARAAHSGRATTLLHGGRDSALRQILLALAAGRALEDHENPGEATLHVLSGRVRLATTAGTQAWELGPGAMLAVPDERHRVDALEDAVAILSVIPRDRIRTREQPAVP